VSKLFRTAAAVTAAAISEVFPGAQLLGGGETRFGFFYQFIPSYELPPEAVDLLQEKMRQIVRENRPIREAETVVMTAETWLKHRPGALAAMDPLDTVPLVHIGTFCDWMEGPFCPTVRDVGAFQILSMKRVGEAVRLEGAVFARKDELKAFIKKYAQYESYRAIGERLGYWKGELWLEKGLEAKRKVCEAWEMLGEEVAGSDEAIRAYGKAPVWFCRGDTLQQIIYTKDEDSLLQLVEKTFILLGFPVNRRGGQWIAQDGLGCEQVVCELRNEGKFIRLIVPVEKILALVIEQKHLQDLRA
jgi:hypothetical protein